jgi:uncharacterized protein YndB with AHSA1/START domain
MDEASVTIAAPPERVWDLVSDVTQMGRFSPSNTGAKWIGGATGPAVGAKFLGFNKRGLARWITRCEVIQCEQPSRFAFRVTDNKLQWGFRIEPNGENSTLLTQWRNRTEPTPAMAKVAAKFLFRGKIDQEMNDGIRETLNAIKTAAEHPA